MKKLLLLFIIYALTYSGVSSQPSNEGKNLPEKVKILFIGNSLTYTNNLPDLVKKAAKAKGIKVSTQLIAYPNYAIADHWEDGRVQRLIGKKNYDFVIIQQGPSSQMDGRQMLIDYGKKYSTLCKEAESTLCYLMVWPSIAYFETFEAVIQNHKDAASINNARLLPVGEVWKADILRSNNYNYYSLDGFHPSLKGSQVAARVIVKYLFQE